MSRYIHAISTTLLVLSSIAVAQNKPATAVELALTHKAAKYEYVNAVGTLLPNEQVIIKPEVSGKITAIEFLEGTEVEQGDVLIRFDNRAMEAGLKDAKAKQQNAKQNVDRLTAAKGSSSAQQLDAARTAVLQAEAALETAAVELDKMTLKAPFSGIVGLKNFEIGDYIQSGTALVPIVNSDRLKLEFNLPERIAHTVKVGQSVEFTVDNFPNKTFTGDIYALSPEINRDGRSLAIRALYENQENELIPGMFVRLSLKIPLGYDVVIVPEEAVFASEGKQYVYRVLKEGDALIAKLTEVEIGDRSSFTVEILHGLDGEDTIVKIGQARISDGAIIVDAAAKKEIKD